MKHSPLTVSLYTSTSHSVCEFCAESVSHIDRELIEIVTWSEWIKQRMTAPEEM